MYTSAKYDNSVDTLMKAIRRILVCGVILASVLTGGLHVLSAPIQAAGLTTYSNIKNGYSLQYPSDWKSRLASGQDFLFESSDGNSFVAAGTFTGLTTTTMQAHAVNYLKNKKTKAGTIKTARTVIHGVTFATAMGEVRGNGAPVQDLFLLVQRAGKSYVFNGGWAIGLSSTQSEQAEVRSALHSIMFILYHTDSSSGFVGWTLPKGWSRVNGMLISDGSTAGGPTAMFNAGGITNYSVTAEIRIDNPSGDATGCHAFELWGRWNQQGGSYYLAIAGADGCNDSTAGKAIVAYSAPNAKYLQTLVGRRFDPGTSWHTYMLSFSGNEITASIDGGTVLTIRDDRALTGGMSGLTSDGVQLSVRSYTVTTF